MKIVELMKKIDKEMLNESPFLKGSLYHSKVSCGYDTCKKCKSGAMHPVLRFTYVDETGKKTSTTIPEKYISEVKETWEKYKYYLDLEKELKREFNNYLKMIDNFKKLRYVPIKKYLKSLH